VDQIESLDALRTALGAPRFLLLKHSRTCPVSTRALGEVERFLADHADLPAAWLDVRSQRELSGEVAEATGVGHASPQVFFVKDGAVAWHASHFDITWEKITAAL